ncbi:MAG: hypothetical protein F6J86_08520 [Symploca sp. SIO1B1]|nr:hypothetical protein [Symploca sp. SIO1B1]
MKYVNLLKLILLPTTKINIFCWLILASYVIPILYKLVYADYFAYSNAWDEPTYLSYQGALAAKDSLGYYLSSHICLILHNLGIAGGLQNLLFDVAIPVALFLIARNCLTKINKQLNIKESQFYALIILFGSVFFNRSNSLIDNLIQQDIPNLVSGMENYPSILRTPQPQVSYLLVFVFIQIFLRYKYLFFLYIPIPFLYWSVAIPYIFIVVSYSLYSWTRSSKLWVYVLINIITTLVLGGFFFILLQLIAQKSQALNSTILFSEFHSPLYSLTFIISLGFYLTLNIVYFLSQQNIPTGIHYIYITSISCLLFIANLQVFTRIRLHPPGLQDSSGTLITSCLFALTIYLLLEITQNLLGLRISFLFKKTIQSLIFSLMLFLVLNTQNFSFTNWQYKVYLGPRIGDEYLKQIKQDSLHAVMNPHAAANLTLIAPKLLAPPFSYQYKFPSINKLCSLNESLMRRAYQYSLDYQDKDGELFLVKDTIKERMEEYFKSAEISQKTGYLNDDHVCLEEQYSSNNFYIVPLEKKPNWGFFPDW